MTTTTKAKKESPKRNEIRLVDVPEALFKKIEKNATKQRRSNPNEVLIFLEANYK